MTFADALRSAMGKLTQNELAEKTGIRQATISRYVTGKLSPGFENLERLEAALPKLRRKRAA